MRLKVCEILIEIGYEVVFRAAMIHASFVSAKSYLSKLSVVIQGAIVKQHLVSPVLKNGSLKLIRCFTNTGETILPPRINECRPY